jgi:hypothetical protein
MTIEKPLLLVLQEQIQASHGAVLESSLRLLDQAYYAADVNHQELVAGVEKATDPQLAIDLAMVRSQKKLARVQLEIARLLQNYLDSANSLLDRINDLVKNTMPEIEDAWNRRRDEAEREPAIAFIKELRNYVHHSRQPVMTSTFNVMRGSGDGFDFSAMLSISRGQLALARSWGKHAMQYLASQTQDEIRLDRLGVDSFGASKQVVDWAVTTIRATYRDALAEVKALREKYSAEYEREIGADSESATKF